MLFSYIAVLSLLLFCPVPCGYAQGNSRSEEVPDTSRTYFISYRLEGEQGHRLFLQKDTLGIEVNGMGLFPPYTRRYVIGRDSCLMFQDKQAVQEGIRMDLPVFASLEGKLLQRVSDKEIRISGQERPYFSEQAVKDALNGMDMLWVCDGLFVTDAAGLEKLRNKIADAPDVQVRIMSGQQAFGIYGMVGIYGAVVVYNKVAGKYTEH